MRRNSLCALIAALSLAPCAQARATVYSKTRPQIGKSVSMTDPTSLIDLFDRWESVWHDERYELIPGCVSDTYIRHDQQGDRTVTRDAYAAEIRQVHKARPGIRVVVYDHAFVGDRAWFRFAFKWIDPETREPRSQAGFQSYRTEGGKLVETWVTLQPLGSAWPDVFAQKSWTSSVQRD